MENYLIGVALGQLVWLFSYGLNRIFLSFERFLV